MDHRFLFAAAGILAVGVAGGAVLIARQQPAHEPVAATTPQARPAPAGLAVPAQPEVLKAREGVRPDKRQVVNGRVQPARVTVPNHANGKYVTVRHKADAPKGEGPLYRYIVEVEQGLPYSGDDFADEVHRILNDPRGWGRFKRVTSGPVTVRVSLSSPVQVDDQCFPLQTAGRLSCFNGTRAVINAMRWNEGADSYGKDLASYREYLINHEVGHSLGHGHKQCPGKGKLAPVMVQQTKSVGSCEPNPWPHPGRLRSEL
ncbi:DUF3152 domain-containing protein [Acrocarpospora catenulata]|uniref:DUF3152 domain-containing protein n=1 Tax=Acrocarpospora catenulata TaxID=2836182 RepID=UPI0027E1C7F1|nr:DUF3152 domain-containing protein [Acrocarpospora catenulata]